MFYSQIMEHRTYIIYEKARRLIYPSISKLTFTELLDKIETKHP